MRSKEEILKDYETKDGYELAKLQMEVLLDIRDAVSRSNVNQTR